MINIYGIPNYKEVNPGLFTIVTFPYLFGIMFGDVGHGLLMLCGAIYLFYSETKPNSPFYSAKYLILMMGIFSIYCGLIYNEFFGKPLIFFNSCETKKDCVYPFGIDWIWY